MKIEEEIKQRKKNKNDHNEESFSTNYKKKLRNKSFIMELGDSLPLNIIIIVVGTKKGEANKYERFSCST